MQRINLFSAAKENGAEIQAAFEQVKTPTLESNAARIQSDAHVSTNRGCEALVRFLTDGALLSGFRYAQRLAATGGRPFGSVEDFCEFLRFRWLSADALYIRRRMAFLMSFEHGEDQFFGALNAGGAGAAAQDNAYGEYCIVLREQLFEADANLVAYCMNDTLAHDEYWRCHSTQATCARAGLPDAQKKTACPHREPSREKQLDALECEPNREVMLRDYAPHSHRGKLAAIKHKDRGAGTPGWDVSMVIEYKERTTEDYIEACFQKDAIAVADVEEIRVHPYLISMLFDELCVPSDSRADTPSPLVAHMKAWELIDKTTILFEPPWRESDE